MSNANLPIALRPAVEFAPTRGSLFDDPGDEKSWHRSQRSESLNRYYEGRDPSWYASAIAPLAGSRRVLDLGCGPGLALQALLAQGATGVLGVDRWMAFAHGADSSTPVVAHDLTLPMPFLSSGSFDAVLSHYALDYVSPIGMRQVLREAHRVLAPGGRLLVYVAAIGLGSGDATRTVPYSPAALRPLLEEAGFDEVEVEAPAGGRNSVARARRSSSPASSPGGDEVRAVVEGDTQLSAAFPAGSERLECELSGPARSTSLRLELPAAAANEEGSRVSVCARCLPLAGGGSELQLWVWRGTALVRSERLRFEWRATELRLRCGGEVEHFSAWNPRELPVEPAGDAYASASGLRPGADLAEAERGAEGRRIVVERSGEEEVDAAALLSPSRNRFLVRRPAGLDLARLDSEWLAGDVHGIVLDAAELEGAAGAELALWAGWREALLLLEGDEWEPLLAAAGERG
jgi:SAM-dependent methyltransferase